MGNVCPRWLVFQEILWGVLVVSHMFVLNMSKVWG